MLLISAEIVTSISEISTTLLNALVVAIISSSFEVINVVPCHNLISIGIIVKSEPRIV